MSSPSTLTIGSLAATGALELGDGYRTRQDQLGDEGFRILRAGDISDGQILTSGNDFVRPEYAGAIGGKSAQPGDVVITTKGTVGRVAMMPAAVGQWVYSPQLCYVRVRNEDVVSRRFILYWLQSPEFWAQALHLMHRTDMAPYISLTDLRSVSMSLPSNATQQAIAEVLGALDDKIAANADLVTVADDLVSLEFARLTADHPDDTALTDIADFVNGRAFTKGASGTGRVVIRIAELNSGIGNSTVFSDADVPEVHVARPGDVLFAWSGSLTVHRWFLAEAIVNQHIFKVIPKNGWPRWAVHRALAQRLPYFKAVAADRATTMGHIQRRHLEETLRLPSAESIAQADQTIDPIWRRALAAEAESVTLAELRNALLPKLMSGELRVKDAEREVGEVL